MSNANVSTGPPGASGDQQSAGMQDKAQDAVGQAQEMAGEAAEKARDAAGKAQDNVRSQIDERSTKAGEQVAGTAEDLRSVGEELRKQGKDTPAKLADRAAEQTERVGSYLKQSDPDKMLHDVEDFGRQRPWAVLAGGMVLGVATARFLKSSSRGRYQQRTGSGFSAPGPQLGTPARQAAPAPAQPLGTPAAAPQPPVPAVAPDPMAHP
jgi:hypothetical protein